MFVIVYCTVVCQFFQLCVKYALLNRIHFCLTFTEVFAARAFPREALLGLRMRIMPRAKECQSGSSTRRLRSISDLRPCSPRDLALHSPQPPRLLLPRSCMVASSSATSRSQRAVRARMRAKVLIDIPEVGAQVYVPRRWGLGDPLRSLRSLAFFFEVLGTANTFTVRKFLLQCQVSGGIYSYQHQDSAGGIGARDAGRKCVAVNLGPFQVCVLCYFTASGPVSSAGNGATVSGSSSSSSTRSRSILGTCNIDEVCIVNVPI